MKLDVEKVFFADYFFKSNISDLELNDFSDFGLKTFHPHLIKFLKKLDIYDHIDEAINTNKFFDIISMDNVLEHVIDPELLLRKLMNLMHDKSVIRITVPNDFYPFRICYCVRALVKKLGLMPRTSILLQ